MPGDGRDGVWRATPWEPRPTPRSMPAGNVQTVEQVAEDRRAGHRPPCRRGLHESGVGRDGAALLRRRPSVRDPSRQSVAVGSHGEKVNRIFVVVLRAVAVGGAAPLAARGQRVAQPERPTVATHAGTVAPGYFEIETGVERDRINRSNSVGDSDGPQIRSRASRTAERLRLSSRARRSRPRASATPGLGVKWRLLDDAPVLGDFAVFPAVKFPTGSLPDGMARERPTLGSSSSRVTKSAPSPSISMLATSTAVGTGRTRQRARLCGPRRSGVGRSANLGGSASCTAIRRRVARRDSRRS